MSREHCKGCPSNTYYKDGSCKFNAYNDCGQCPCSVCIVKVMCQDVCDDFNKFRIGIIEEIQYDL